MSCEMAACQSVKRQPPCPETAGDPVLLLHGSLSSHAVWRDLQDALAPVFPTVTPDLIGYGASSAWPDEAPFGLDDEMKALADVLPCCGGPYHVVGYSYGGALALYLACNNPARVLTLTLIEPVFFAALRYAGDWQAYRKFAFARDDFVTAYRAGDVETAMAGFVDFWTGAGAWGSLPNSVRNEIRAMAPKVALDWQASFVAEVGLDLLSTLGRRTLLLCGDRSPPPMRRLVDSLHGVMPGSHRTVVAGAGHMLPLTHRHDLGAAVLAHLHADFERRLH